MNFLGKRFPIVRALRTDAQTDVSENITKTHSPRVELNAKSHRMQSLNRVLPHERTDPYKEVSMPLPHN